MKNLVGEKRRKEPNSSGMAQEEKPAGRERREVTRMEEKKIAAYVHNSFNSMMQCEIKSILKCFTL